MADAALVLSGAAIAQIFAWPHRSRPGTANTYFAGLDGGVRLLAGGGASGRPLMSEINGAENVHVLYHRRKRELASLPLKGEPS